MRCPMERLTSAACSSFSFAPVGGFATVGFVNPLRKLTSGAAHLATLLRSLSGPLVLVGHSYGGAVISNAATGNEQVRR